MNKHASKCITVLCVFRGRKIVIGAMAVIIAALALYISRRTLQEQQKIFKQQMYLHLSDYWNQGAPMRRPIDEWSEQELQFLLDFFDIVGYLVSNGLLDKKMVENHWGTPVKSLPEFPEVKGLIHRFRHTLGYPEAWTGVDSLIKDLGGDSHPFRQEGS